MRFTDRFIEFPITLIDSKGKDLGLTVDDIPAIAKIDPRNIQFYRTGLPDEYEKDQSEKTVVYLNSGESIRIELTLREFEKIINSAIVI